MTEEELWWIHAVMEEIDQDEEKYSEWEQKFMGDMAEKAERCPDYPLSEKQREVLQRIYRK